MASQAPIAIFCYRRPEHLHRTLKSLMQCDGFEGSPVFVFGDGPRNESEQASVDATRAVARELLGDRAEYHFSDVNRGLSTSVIAGINAVIERFERVVVVEDDLELSPDFLRYMNTALDRYADDARVFQISGYMFDAPEINSNQDAVFLPFTISWGWATWRRAWHVFDAEASGWQRLLSDGVFRKSFNIDGTYDFSSMLVRQMLGFRDSWAVRWCWSVFGRQGVILYPPTTMVRNTGFDGSGTHGRGLLRRFSSGETHDAGSGIVLPKQVQVDPVLYAYVKQALWRQNGRFLGWLTDKWRWQKTKRLVARHIQQTGVSKT
jgi:hypothetical protein